MELRLASPIMFDSIVDGPGLRTVIWTQGCTHKCEGCHNPQTHSLKGGYEVECVEVINQLKKSKLQKGITLSGGEPFLQPRQLKIIAKEAKKMKLDIWAYTGFTFEQLIDKSAPEYKDRMKLLNEVDILVDGKFEKDKTDIELMYRGSYNQRIIDVQRSLHSEKLVLSYEYMEQMLSAVK
ncbi:MAG: anaerobic ribonucleoside-triphosphate reductase activating protein [Peptostreptococcaceae bacterium]